MADTSAPGPAPATCAPTRQRIKLSAAQVQEIRQSPLSVRQAAKVYGVTFSYVSRIRCGTARTSTTGVQS